MPNEAYEGQSTYQKTVKSGGWMLLGNILQKGLGLVTFFILARWLSPHDYGVIAVVLMMVGLLDIVTTPGFERALVQREGDVNEYLPAVWTFGLVKSLLVAGLVAWSAPYIADFFHISGNADVIRLGAWLVLLTGLTNVRQLYFFKALDFRKVFWRDFSSQIVYTAVALLYAFYIEASVAALITAHIVRYAVAVAMSYVLDPAWPRLSFAFSKLKDLIGYSRWVVGQNILNYFLGILDTVYVGRFLNAAALGAYTKARDLAFAPFSPISNIVNRVGFPAYASVQDKLPKLQVGFIKTLDILLPVGLPAVLLFLAEGGTIIQILLGPAWLSIVVPLKILAVATLLGSLVTLTKPLFDGIGRPDINFKLAAMQLVTSVVLIYLGVKWREAAGVAWAMLATWLLNFVYAVYAARPILRLGWQSFRPTIYPLAVALIFVSLVALPGYAFGIGRAHNPWLTGAWVCALGLVYMLVLWQTSKRFPSGPWPTLLSICRSLRS